MNTSPYIGSPDHKLDLAVQQAAEREARREELDRYAIPIAAALAVNIWSHEAATHRNLAANAYRIAQAMINEREKWLSKSTSTAKP